MLKLVFFICLISARRWSESGQGIIYITGRERRRCSDHPFFTTNQGRGIGVIGLGLPLLAPAAETPGCVAFVLVFADGKNGICRGPVSEQRFYGLSILLLQRPLGTVFAQRSTGVTPLTIVLNRRN